MKKQVFAPLMAILIAMAMLLIMFGVFSRDGTVVGPVLAAPMQGSPTVTLVDPASATNDLDFPIAITGSDFVATPTVYLGDTELGAVTWVSATLIEATVPWGMDPGVYTLTVQNPGGETGGLVNAFTVTQGIGVWNATTLYGGDVQQVIVHPQSSETVYAISENVGLFRSRDGGDTWVFITAGTYVHDLAIAPTTTDTLYLSMIAQTADGLHRSDDGGDTWTPLYAPGDIPFPHPTDSGTLFASNRWEGQSGLWRSTDYGQTWLTVTTGLTDTRVNNLVFDLTDPLTIYVGTELGNLFVSGDGGTSWDFVAQPTDFIQALAINPWGDHELWVSNCAFCVPNITLRSTNASHTAWETVPGSVGSVSQRSIVFAPDAWGATYSQTLFVANTWDAVMRSDDGGDTWTDIDPQPNEWHFGLGLHPDEPDVLYATGGRQAIYKTSDGGVTWRVANEGLTAVVPEQLATVAGQPDVVYAVTDIGLLKGTRGGATWQVLPVGGGDVNFVATDPFTPSSVYVAGGDVGGGILPVYISQDGGQTWPITTGLPEPSQYAGYAHTSPILQPDPAQPEIWLAGVRHMGFPVGAADAGSLFRSTDAGLTWVEVDVGQVISPVQDIAFDVVNPAIVYMATSIYDAGSGLWRSTDGGLTWQRVGDTIADLDRPQSIAVEPRPPYRVFVLTWGIGDTMIYVAADRGLTWSQAGSIVHGSSQSLLSSHDQPGSILYMTTGIGLLRSTDGGESWDRAAGILGRVPIYALAEAATDDRTILYAGTTGGYVESSGAQASSRANDSSLLVNAGVYRYTTQHSWPVYLPLVVRAYRP